MKYEINVEIKLKLFDFINSFHASGFFLYPLKTLENLYVFRGHSNRPMSWNVLRILSKPVPLYCSFNLQLIIKLIPWLPILNTHLAGTYSLKINNRNTRTRCEICSKLTAKTPERRHWCRYGVFIVNFEHISHLVPEFRLLIWTCNCRLGTYLRFNNTFENISTQYSTMTLLL